MFSSVIANSYHDSTLYDKNEDIPLNDWPSYVDNIISSLKANVPQNATEDEHPSDINRLEHDLKRAVFGQNGEPKACRGIINLDNGAKVFLCYAQFTIIKDANDKIHCRFIIFWLKFHAVKAIFHAGDDAKKHREEASFSVEEMNRLKVPYLTHRFLKECESLGLIRE